MGKLCLKGLKIMANAKQLAPGKWRLDAYKNGMRKTFRGKSRGEVEKAERDWLNDIEAYGTEIRKTTDSLDTVMHDLLFINLKQSLTQSGFERYMSCYNTHFKGSSFARKTISSYSQKDIQKFLNSYKEMSETSIKMIYILLNKTFEYAVDNNLLRINPVSKTVKPKSLKEKRDISALTIAEQEVYIKACNSHKYGDLFTFALLTGMRQGELIALKWDDVDLQKKEIHIKHTSRVVRTYDDFGEFKDVSMIKPTKTKSSNRIIPIAQNVKLILNKLYLKSDSDFVFSSKDGLQLKNSTIQKAHNNLLKDSNLRHIPFHALRHTFATRQIELGVDVRTLSELLGHADVSITLNRYCHSTTESKIEAMSKMDKLISTL